MREKLTLARTYSQTLSAENARLALVLSHSSEDLAKVKAEVETVKIELESLHFMVVSSQGPMIQASLYMLVQT